MDKQQLSTRFFPIMVFSLLALTLTFAISGCRREEDAVHHFYIKNATSQKLEFRLRRTSGFLVKEFEMPANEKSLFGGGALHFKPPNVVFQTIDAYYGLPSDTVEIVMDGNILFKWGGPLRVMEPGINHFYNENSWHIEPSSGFRCRYEHSTFTIYESDLPPKGGN